MLNPLTAIKNVIHPKGRFIVLLGPDGCGKSTVTSGLINNQNNLFSGVWHFHWRPKLLPHLRRKKKQSDDITPVSTSTPPPTTSKYRGLTSLIRYLYYWLDFILGYWLIIYPKKIRSELIIGERHFPDVLVHPERYGFAVPMPIMRITSMFVPNPDIIFLLTGEPEEIYARKQELTVEMITEQLKNYSDELTHWKSHALIDTSDGADHVIESIQLHIDNSRLPTEPNVTTSVKKYAFPSIGTTRLLLDASMPVKLISKLYSPGSFSGRSLLSMANALGYTFGVFIFREIKSHDFGALPLCKAEHIIREQYDDDISISYFLGNKGPRSKVTAQISRGDKIDSYTKIGFGDEVTHLILNEHEVLNSLKPILEHSIPIATSLINEDKYVYLTQTAPLQDSKKRNHLLSANDCDFVMKILNTTMRKLHTDDYSKELNLDERINSIANQPDTNQLVSSLNSALDKFHTSTAGEIVVGRCHGDYTMWNTLCLKDDSLFVFDWEYSRTNGPALSDIFHFLRMHRQMTMKLMPEETCKSIFDKSSDHYYLLKDHAAKLNIDLELLPDYFALYLIQEILRHAETGSSSELTSKIYPSQLPQITYLTDCLACYVNESLYEH